MSNKITDRYQFEFSNYHIDGNNSEGYFARCYRGIDNELNKCVALKYLRHELPHPRSLKIMPPFDIHYDAFCREAEMLELLSSLGRNGENMTWVPKLYNMGYLKGLQSSTENQHPLDGEFDEILTVKEFKEQAIDRMKEGWRPYLSMEYFPIQKNIQYINEFYSRLFRKLSISKSSDVVYPHLPIFQALLFSLQVARLFKHIHRNPIDNGGAFFYPDSKLPHFFWNGIQSALIDWNRVWFFSEKGINEYVYSELSDESDIQHFVSVPLFALLTGRDPAGKQPFFGGDSKPPDYKEELEYIRNGYPEEIHQLFVDVLTLDGSIKDALTFENRCELLLDKLFNYSTNQEKKNDFQAILENLEQADDHINTAWEILRDNLLFSKYPDVHYLSSILNYIRECSFVPWASKDFYADNF